LFVTHEGMISSSWSAVIQAMPIGQGKPVAA
jgi:hypothetical protein